MVDPNSLGPTQRRLLEEYDRAALEVVMGRVGPHFFDRLADLDAVDPAWAANYLHFIAGVHGRTVLDPKTRALVAVGEVTVLGNEVGVRIHAADALDAGASQAEVAEVILQSAVLNGFPKAHRALRVFRQLLESREEDREGSA